MFKLQGHPIDTIYLRKEYSDAANGAFVCFEGMVRMDVKNGRQTQSLLYIADAAACLDEGRKILEEAVKQFPLSNIVCVQRTGLVPVLETAIWIGVWAGHRDEAFKGCRFVIEEIKKRLLIWKKEYYTDGSNTWIRGTQIPSIG